MTQEQIKQAAKGYANRMWNKPRDYGTPKEYSRQDFLAGAESRQAEVTELVDVLRALSDVFIEMYEGAYPNLANEPIIISAQELLKKHSK